MTVVPFPNIEPNEVQPGFRSNTKVNRSVFTGAVTTYARGGDHSAVTFSFRDLSSADAARLETFLRNMRGMGNRCYARLPGYTRRGSGLGSELFSNGDFSSGTTGWSSQGDISFTVADYIARIAVSGNTGGGTAPAIYQSPTLAANIHYSMRSIIHDGRGSVGLSAGTYLNLGDVEASSYSTSARGLIVQNGVCDADGAQANYPSVIDNTDTWLLGDFISCSFASMARCALVDNGQNLLTYSDQADNAAWTKTRCTVSANAGTAPDGSSTADMLVEDGTAADTHFISQDVTVTSSTNIDFSFGRFVRADNRTWVQLSMQESVANHAARAWFNLSSGAAGTVDVTGANWADARASISDAGNGWYYCSVTARKVSAGTTLTSITAIAEGDGDSTFDGLSQNSILVWRATAAQSTMPSRPIQTVASATTGSSQTGSALHLKGLPASTSGILLAGDPVQIPGIDQVVWAKTALNSDAAGLGYFEFEGPLFNSPADNDPVIDVTPLMRCYLDASSVSFPKRPGVFTDIDFTLVEDIT